MSSTSCKSTDMQSKAPYFHSSQEGGKLLSTNIAIGTQHLDELGEGAVDR